MDSYFSMISHDQHNWLGLVKPFYRILLISSFYKIPFFMWKMSVSIIMILYIDHSSISSSFATKNTSNRMTNSNLKELILNLSQI
ncbi:hypothetical protein CXB51_016572 [Gossypium anomalum]|uniref:Ycf2 N-terminal domain-containing protein n=1 Tax=Gossypium anomalum TaxID=47600 RepID=A0A8J5YFK9_9ROSI|nr:hypothetical protein CXB51_016572 [Gossypium anomalum]